MNFKNLLLGIAIGDAFGAGVEFQDRDWIKENVNFTKFVNARQLINVSKEQLDNFVKDYQPWDYTDDTEMTIGCIKAVLSNRFFSENPLNLIPYCQSFIKDIDQETFSLLNAVDRLPAPEYLTEKDYIILGGPQPIEKPRFFAGIKGVPSDAMLTAATVLYLLKYTKDAFSGLK